jgi:hypothetical protein
MPATTATRRVATPGQPQNSTSARRATKLVRARNDGSCEIRVPGVCLGGATNFCHRIADGQGGPRLASNGVAGCGSGTTGCHGWTHDHPDLAKAHGWMIAPTYQVVEGRRVMLDADAFPAYLWRPDADEPEWVWLDDAGGAVTVAQIADVELYEVMAGEVLE